MDLESECSALESVEDNEAVASQSTGHVDKINTGNNGSVEGERNGFDYELLADSEGHDVRVMETVNSPPLTLRSPSGSVGSSPPTATKGYGLKKWRRIKRDIVKEESSSVDNTKTTKRVLSTLVGNPTKPQNSPIEMKQRSEGSVSSTNAIVKTPGAAIDGFSIHGSPLDPQLANGPIFAAGMDSENSEDRSSKSSTAASVPKSRHDMPMMVGNSRDKNKLRSLSGKNLGNSVQRGQQGKVRVETSKKPRGERVKIEKENSHSSMESDSRSSNFVFMQGANSVTANGRQSAKSMNYDWENSDDAQGGERQFSEELQTDFGKENVVEYEDLSQEYTTAEKSDHHRSSGDQDPLAVSIFGLQSVKEALEKELEKFREIGIEQTSVFDGTPEPSCLPTEFTSDNTNGELEQSSSVSLGIEVTTLKQNIDILGSKLEEARTMLKEKEDKVVELEAYLASSKSPNKETGITFEMQQEKYRDMEDEIEGLFKQKVEAEIECLALSSTIQKLRVVAVDRTSVIEEPKGQALEKAQVEDKLGDSESDTLMPKRRAEMSDTYRGEIVEADEVLKLQNRVWKITSCLILQVILLAVVFVLFVLQISPRDSGFVPT